MANNTPVARLRDPFYVVREKVLRKKCFGSRSVRFKLHIPQSLQITKGCAFCTCIKTAALDGAIFWKAVPLTVTILLLWASL